MDHGPLVTDDINAGASFAREFSKYAPVKTAFWLKASDDVHRYLYIASDQIRDSTIGMAYEEVLRVAYEVPTADVDPFRVKLIGASSSLAKAAVDILIQNPRRTSRQFGGRIFGDVMVDDVYIYSPDALMPEKNGSA